MHHIVISFQNIGIDSSHQKYVSSYCPLQLDQMQLFKHLCLYSLVHFTGNMYTFFCLVLFSKTQYLRKALREFL